MGAAWAFDPTITSKSGLLTSLDRARRQSTRRLPARCEALHRATLRIIASLGPQMGPQTHISAYVRVGKVVNLLLSSALVGMGASCSQSRCATRLRHAPRRPAGI
jgi:hypothetical protein